jgi:hypothetical protein
MPGDIKVWKLEETMQETIQEMHDRLLEVITKYGFEVCSQPDKWQRLADRSQIPAEALAVVKDGEAWFALAPAAHPTEGSYRVVAFHFPEGTNASGFVAWLAGILKQEAGTGAMVVNGFDTRSTSALWADLARAVRLLGLPMGEGRRHDCSGGTPSSRWIARRASGGDLGEFNPAVWPSNHGTMIMTRRRLATVSVRQA